MKRHGREYIWCVMSHGGDQVDPDKLILATTRDAKLNAIIINYRGDVMILYKEYT